MYKMGSCFGKCTEEQLIVKYESVIDFSGIYMNNIVNIVENNMHKLVEMLCKDRQPYIVEGVVSCTRYDDNLLKLSLEKGRSEIYNKVIELYINNGWKFTVEFVIAIQYERRDALQTMLRCQKSLELQGSGWYSNGVSGTIYNDRYTVRKNRSSYIEYNYYYLNCLYIISPELLLITMRNGLWRKMYHQNCSKILLVACMDNHIELAELLLDHPLHFSIKYCDKQGNTAYTYAKSHGMTDIVNKIDVIRKQYYPD